MEGQTLIKAFESLLFTKIQNPSEFFSKKCLNLVLSKLDADHFDCVIVNSLQDFLDNLIYYCELNGLKYCISKETQLQLQTELTKLEQREGLSIEDLNMHWVSLLVDVLAILILFHRELEEVIQFRETLCSKLDLRISQLSSEFDPLKRLRSQEKALQKFKKLKEFEMGSLKADLKHQQKKLSKMREDLQKREQLLSKSIKQEARLCKRGKELLELIKHREREWFRERAQFKQFRKKLEAKNRQIAQLSSERMFFEAKIESLGKELHSSRQNYQQHATITKMLTESQEKVDLLKLKLSSQKEESLSETQSLKEENVKISEECQKVHSQAADLDFRFSQIKSGMEYYRNSYRALLTEKMKEDSYRRYVSQPGTDKRDNYFDEDPMEKQYSTNKDLFKNEEYVSFEEELERIKNENQVQIVEENIFNEDFFEQKGMHKKQEIKLPTEEEWEFDEGERMIDLSGSFELQSNCMSQKLEDIMEESNESECQSGYSSTRRVSKVSNSRSCSRIYRNRRTSTCTSWRRLEATTRQSVLPDLARLNMFERRVSLPP